MIAVVGGNNASTSYSGALSGPGGIKKLGSGTLSLTGANTYTGTTLATGSGSTLDIATGGSIIGTSKVDTLAGGAMTISGTLTLANNGNFGVGSSQTAGTTGFMTVNSGGVLNIGNGSGGTVGYTGIGGSDVIGGGAGAGTLTINGGTVNVAAGGSGVGGIDSSALWLNPYGGSGSSIIISNGGLLSTARPIQNGSGGTETVTFNGGTLRAAASSVGSILGGGLVLNVQAGGATIDVASGVSTASNSAMVHSGTGVDGGLTKNGSGTLTLAATNTYNGGTIVNAGTLTTSGSGNFGASGGNLAVNNTATLNLAGSSRTFGAVTIGGGTISNGTATGTGFTSTGGTVSAALAGSAAALTHNSGTLTLSGANTYSGPTTVNGGSLILNGAAASGTPATAFTIAGGSFGFTTGSASTLALGAGSNFTLSGGTLNFDLGASGVNDLLTADTFTLNANSAVSVTAIDTLALDTPYTVGTFGTVSLGGSTISGSTLGRITVTPTWSGNSLIITPTLQQSSWNNNAGSDWNIAGNWTSYIPSTAGDAALFGPGPGGLTAPGTVTLSVAESVGYMTFNRATPYTIGATNSSRLTLDNGTVPAVVTVNAGSHVINENVVLNSNLTVTTDPTTTLTMNGVVSGAGKGLTKNGAGKLALTGFNTFTGATTINAGTLQIGDGVTQRGNYGLYSNGAGTITVNNGGTLLFSSIDALGGANNNNPITVVVNQGGLAINGKWTGNYSDAHTAGFNTLNNLHLAGGTLRGVAALNGVAGVTPYGAFNIVGTILVDGTTQSTISQAIPTDSDYVGPNGFMTLALGTTTFNVLHNTTGTDLLVSASLNNYNSNVSNLTKTGAGVMSLSGVNGYSGATLISGGTLDVASGGSLSNAAKIDSSALPSCRSPARSAWPPMGVSASLPARLRERPDRSPSTRVACSISAAPMAELTSAGNTITTASPEPAFSTSAAARSTWQRPAQSPAVTARTYG